MTDAEKVTANVSEAAIHEATQALREAWPSDFSARLLARAALTAAYPVIEAEISQSMTEETERLIALACAQAMTLVANGAADIIEKELGGRAKRLMYGDYRTAYLAGIEDAVKVLRKNVRGTDE